MLEYYMNEEYIDNLRQITEKDINNLLLSYKKNGAYDKMSKIDLYNFINYIKIEFNNSIKKSNNIKSLIPHDQLLTKIQLMEHMYLIFYIEYDFMLV